MRRPAGELKDWTAELDKRILRFLIRAVLGLAGGFLLSRMFFGQSNWVLVLILAALVVAAAYVSEAWRTKRRLGD